MKHKLIVGYDLGDSTSQIRFWNTKEKEPETASTVTGEEQYNFPTALCRRPETGQWVYGKEAVRLAEEGSGILVEGLLLLAREGAEVAVGEDTFDPVALLALFMKRSLSLLGASVPLSGIDALVITVEKLDQRVIEVLTQAAAVMQLKTEQIYVQSHVECFYHYMIHQPQELLKGQALVCDYERDKLRVYRLECNRRTNPVVAFAEEKIYPQMRSEDGALLPILEENCEGRMVSAVYLLGRGFEGDWYQDSLRYLCRNRRVFRGNNLYSKGACYGAGEKLLPDDIGAQYVFLGGDQLKANIGMKALRRGQDSYYALLDAGTSWYEAKKTCEFYLETGNSFSITVTPLNGREIKEIEVILSDLPKRDDRATRVCLSISMQSENEAALTVEDLGFGEIYPATHKVWQETFTV
ncbi:MAG: hypothetical protein J6C33_10135 [Lachnospiraceae bacterium]|nr:hypothetical protein [Lachnospiraceae bacterium]